MVFRPPSIIVAPSPTSCKHRVAILPLMDDKTQLHIQPTDAVRRHPHDEHAQKLLSSPSTIADVCSMPACPSATKLRQRWTAVTTTSKASIAVTDRIVFLDSPAMKNKALLCFVGCTARIDGFPKSAFATPHHALSGNALCRSPLK